jgi:hypothetical protein
MTVANLRNFIDTNTEFTQTRVAAAIGVSVSALNGWMKGTYKGDCARLEKSVQRFLEAQHEAGIEIGNFKKDFDFVPTSVFREIEECAKLAEYRGEMRAVTGISGIGKTTGIRKIAEDREGSALFVECYAGMRKNRLLQKLGQAAGISSMHGRFDDMFEYLVSYLKGSGRLIIIDEAEHLPVEALDSVRRIHDFTGCGVLICGHPRFYESLKRFQDRYAYIFNRLSIPVQLKKLSASDASAMVSTMCENEVPGNIWIKACDGIGRDLKIIVQETMRVARDTGVEPSETAAFRTLISTVSKKLSREVEK